MGFLDFIKKTYGIFKNNNSSHESEKRSKFTTKQFMELEEFLYLANKMAINNKVSTDTAHIKSFIEDEISESELNIIKEEIKYMMLCLLHFYAYVELTLHKNVIDLKDQKALEHFRTVSYNSLERAFLISLNDFNYNLEKYKNRYSKYTQYLGKYNYQNFERSFLECFAMQLVGGFNDNATPLHITDIQLLKTAHWVFHSYGEPTKLTLSNQDFIL